jgi:hypothetical protein
LCLGVVPSEHSPQPEAKNDCADEGQHQITRPDYIKGATRILLKSGQPDFQEGKPENLKFTFGSLRLFVLNGVQSSVKRNIFNTFNRLNFDILQKCMGQQQMPQLLPLHHLPQTV